MRRRLNSVTAPWKPGMGFGGVVSGAGGVTGGAAMAGRNGKQHATAGWWELREDDARRRADLHKPLCIAA
jgi:hypothetical protein